MLKPLRKRRRPSIVGDADHGGQVGNQALRGGRMARPRHMPAQAAQQRGEAVPRNSDTRKTRSQAVLRCLYRAAETSPG